MRKFFAILMLTVCLFNLAGYSFLFNFYIYKADQRITHRVNADLYAEENLKEIKVKLNLPYLSDWADYEKFAGEIEIGGVHYNYVKRKISQDTLYLLCLPNEAKTELSKLKNQYAIKVNDLPAEKGSKNPLSKKGMLLEGGQIRPIQVIISLYGKEILAHITPPSQNTVDSYIASDEQPPDTFAC